MLFRRVESPGRTTDLPAFYPIESSTPENIERCAQLMMASSPWNVLYFSLEECIETLQPEQNIRVFVHETEGQLVGFMAVLPGGFAEEPMVEYICIADEYRGQGIGTAFMKFFEEVLYPDAINYYLLVSDINADAKRLYERLGYVQVGLLANFNLPGQNEFIMRKTKGPRHLR